MEVTISLDKNSQTHICGSNSTYCPKHIAIEVASQERRGDHVPSLTRDILEDEPLLTGFNVAVWVCLWEKTTVSPAHTCFLVYNNKPALGGKPVWWLTPVTPSCKRLRRAGVWARLWCLMTPSQLDSLGKNTSSECKVQEPVMNRGSHS